MASSYHVWASFRFSHCLETGGQYVSDASFRFHQILGTFVQYFTNSRSWNCSNLETGVRKTLDVSAETFKFWKPVSKNTVRRFPETFSFGNWRPSCTGCRFAKIFWFVNENWFPNKFGRLSPPHGRPSNVVANNVRYELETGVQTKV